jgi:hypothetical protein
VAPFEVACRCGRVLRGTRLRTHQVRRCEHCGAAVFVLPRSPLPPLPAAPLAQAVAVVRRRRWLAPVGAVALALIVTWWFWPPTADAPALDAGEFTQRLAEARQQLNSGAYRQAAAQFALLRTARHARPGLLPAQDVQELHHLERQAAALAELCGEPLEALLAHAAAAAEPEWLADFPHRYGGKAVLLDLEIRGAGGHFEHSYLLWAGGEPAELDLDDLRLLGQLPLQSRQRMVFLARLASVRREPGRGWVVRLQGDSGVLLTEAGAARVCCPALAGAEFEALLERQRGWALGPATK